MIVKPNSEITDCVISTLAPGAVVFVDNDWWLVLAFNSSFMKPNQIGERRYVRVVRLANGSINGYPEDTRVRVVTGQFVED